jgi:hypothetical protein
VGTKSGVISMFFYFSVPTTLGSPAVLTQQGGTASPDFADAGTGTCKAGTSYNANSFCTVDVTLTPSQAGLRTGVVELVDNSSNLLALGNVQGGTPLPSQITITGQGIFNVGNTGSSIDVTGQVTGSASGPVPTGTVTITGQNINATGILDASGDFNIPMNVPGLPYFTTITPSCSYSGDKYYLPSTNSTCFFINSLPN